MSRIPASVVTVVMVGSLVAGCGGDSPYCAAVKEHRTALDSFGRATTDKTFAKEARAVRAIAATEPAKVGDDWAAIDKAMRGVLSALKKAGTTFDGLNDADERASLDAADVERINKAYSAFNDTAAQRKAVVADVDKTCDVSLR